MIFAEKYTCRRIRSRATRTSTRCPRAHTADYLCALYSLRSCFRHQYRSPETTRSDTGMR
eukprot:3036651-Pleurochrysis_carterae.AAC.1